MTEDDIENWVEESMVNPNPVIAVLPIGLTPIFPVIEVAPVVEIPDFVKITKLPAEPRLTGVCGVKPTAKLKATQNNATKQKRAMNTFTIVLFIRIPLSISIIQQSIKTLSITKPEIRFWIAQEVAETKEKHDTRTLFFRAKRLMGKQPKTLITDGLPSYSIACDQVFEGTQHIHKITLSGKQHNNNQMERMNGEIRDREKTMRGLKRKRTPILSGYQIFHNYIRPHEGLDGKTPAEACGIKIERENKWMTIIQNASHVTKVNSKTSITTS